MCSCDILSMLMKAANCAKMLDLYYYSSKYLACLFDRTLAKEERVKDLWFFNVLSVTDHGTVSSQRLSHTEVIKIRHESNPAPLDRKAVTLLTALMG